MGAGGYHDGEHAVIPLHQVPHMVTGRAANGAQIAMGWDCAAWYYAYDFIAEQPSQRAPCVIVTLDKLVLNGGEFKRDPEPKWRSPPLRFIEVSADQRLLLYNGDWVSAHDLKPGQYLTNMCGNGHVSMVEAVEPVGEKECVGFVVTGLKNYILAGVVLEASGGTSDGRGLGREPDCAGRAGDGADSPARSAVVGSGPVDGPPQRMGDAALA